MSSQGSSCHASSSPYEVLTTTEVVQLMESQISEVSAIANVSQRSKSLGSSLNSILF